MAGLFLFEIGADQVKEWYAIKIAAGKEQRVLKQLADVGIEARALTKGVYERKQGRLELREKYLFPGYMLIFAEMTMELYYTLKNMWYVQYALKGIVLDDELEAMQKFGLQSESMIDYTGDCIKYSGPIAGLVKHIIKVDKRKGRVLLSFDLAGEKVKGWIRVMVKR